MTSVVVVANVFVSQFESAAEWKHFPAISPFFTYALLNSTPVNFPLKHRPQSFASSTKLHFSLLTPISLFWQTAGYLLCALLDLHSSTFPLVTIILTSVRWYSFSSDDFSTANNDFNVIVGPRCTFMHRNFLECHHRFYSEITLTNEIACATQIVVCILERTRAPAIALEFTMSPVSTADAFDP